MKPLVIIIFITSIIFPTNCYGAAIGNITDQTNTPASIQRQNVALSGTKGVDIEMNDVIKTVQGKVGIVFEDKTRVQINENSKLVIDSFVYDSTKGIGKLAVNVALGTVRYTSGQISKNDPQNVKINTPSATISVRGTDFTATVDELGASTIILLPSCPIGWQNIILDCVTGKIFVESDEGIVVLDQPFQATKVFARGISPTKPIILNLTDDAISNILILSPPKELKKEERIDIMIIGFLDTDYLKFDGLDNIIDKQQAMIYTDRLSINLLEKEFLENFLDILAQQMAEQLRVFKKEISIGEILPDLIAATGVVAIMENNKVQLCRDNGNDVQCVTMPDHQNAIVYNIQSPIEVKNRINAGDNTIITLNQK